MHFICNCLQAGNSRDDYNHGVTFFKQNAPIYECVFGYVQVTSDGKTTVFKRFKWTIFIAEQLTTCTVKKLLEIKHKVITNI